MANGTFGGGTGSTASPYLVEDKADFLAMKSGFSYSIVNDIDFANQEFSTGLSMFGSTQFSNTTQIFGNGKTIRNVKFRYTTDSNSFGGFFYLFRGSITDLHFRNITMVIHSPSAYGGELYIGLLSSYAMGPVSRCSLTGSITSTGAFSNTAVRYIGGFVGYSYGDIKDCWSEVHIDDQAGWWIGGFIGEQYAGTVSNCYSSGTIKGMGDAGGFVYKPSSSSSSPIKNCFSLVSNIRQYINNNPRENVGRFSSGKNPGTGSIIGCYARSDMTYLNDNV